MAGVSISCCVLSMSQATLQKDLLENECLSLILKINKIWTSTYNQELDATEHSCCVVYLWDEGVMSSWTITNLPWSSYPQLLQFLLSSWAGPVPWPVQPHWPHALSNNIKQVSGQASQNPLACLMTLTTCPVKQHQTYISGQASQAPWPIQPHWPHALSNNIYSNTGQAKQVEHLGLSNHADHMPCQTTSTLQHVRPRRLICLACPATFTTHLVKQHWTHQLIRSSTMACPSIHAHTKQCETHQVE